jgi:hypothetical protein
VISDYFGSIDGVFVVVKYPSMKNIGNNFPLNSVGITISMG